ncbi:MAG: transposase [Janthinobacterium lividum]
MPRHNLYRRLRELRDWDFLYQQTRPVCRHTGQPSLDPVVFFKLVLMGRLENSSSDRRLVEHCALRLDSLYFLGYEVDEDLPWHSTSSRTRQLYPAAVFEHLFDHVFAQCVARGWWPAIPRPWIRRPSKPTRPWTVCARSRPLPRLRCT